MSNQTQINVQIGCNPHHADVNGISFRWFTVLRPSYDTTKSKAEQYIKVFVKSSKAAGLSKIIQKGRIVKLQGNYQTWQWQGVGEVFLANSFEGISYEHSRPEASNLIFDIQ